MKDPKQHSAEHILSSAFKQLFDSNIIDSRFKGNKVRCDFKINSEIPLEQIIEQAETKANEIISQNHEITFEEISVEEAKKLYAMHRLPEGIEKVRIIHIGDDSATPCRGKHAQNTSEIGKIKIRTSNLIKPDIIRLTFVIE
ncbi:MAG: hypothetical protein ABID45_01025 [Patescibacteria group bacterium]